MLNGREWVMMHMPTQSELRALMEPHDDPCVSLFLPICRAGVDTQQNPLRLRNLLQEAEYHLLLNNLSVTQVAAVLEPLRELVADEAFWLHPDDGLVVFRALDLFRAYWLPSHFKEQAVVTHHFYLRPLLPFLTRDGCGKRQEVAARYREYAVTGRATNNVREIVPAAYEGRIESLFLAADQEQWGMFNLATRALHVHQQARFNDDDLLDVAATQTLLHGGLVYVVERGEMPDEGPLAAVLRS
jgi:hypothetical protein